MQLLIFLSIIFSAGFIQGLTGFGSVLISLPLLCFFYPLKTVIPLVSLFALIINSLLMWNLRKYFSFKAVAPLLLSTLLGLPLGVYFLKNLPSFYLEITLGLILGSYALYGLFIHLPAITIKTRWAYLAGFLAGILGGSLGTNGPPIIVYSSILPLDKHKIKFILTGYFFFAGFGISAIHGISGLITKEVITLFLKGILILILGVFSGIFLYQRMSTRNYKKIVFILLLILSIVFSYRSLTKIGVI